MEVDNRSMMVLETVPGVRGSPVMGVGPKREKPSVKKMFKL